MELEELNPYFRKALRFIKDNDLAALPVGKNVIDGDNLWVNIVDADLRKAENAPLEAHDRYIDIQVPLSGPESYGTKDRSACTSPRSGMDTVNDIVFFDDPIDEVISADPGEMVVFGPETAHAPLIGEGRIHKAIFKVRVVMDVEKLERWFVSLPIRRKEHIALKVLKKQGIVGEGLNAANYPGCTDIWEGLDAGTRQAIYDHCTDAHGDWIQEGGDATIFSY